MGGHRPYWTCPGAKGKSHPLSNYARRYGDLCQRCAEDTVRALVPEDIVGGHVPAVLVRALLDSLDTERKNMQDEMRHTGREIADAVAEAEYWRGKADG